MGKALFDIETKEPEREDGLPPGQLPNGLWKCIGCGNIVGKDSRWLNWCHECGYNEWD